MEFYNKTIGIWGYGRVGKSAVDFFRHHGCKTLCVMDSTPHQAMLSELKDLDVAFFHQHTHQEDFFRHCDIILPSPGIDVRPYKRHQDKWLCEADLFAKFWYKPIIGITGTLGKTTVTTLLTEQLKAHGLHAALGGNIGIPLLSLIAQQEQYDIAVLELSSFQLEYAHSFAPDLAIITNVYPNHLDRHDSFAAYVHAKQRLYLHQAPSHILLAPRKLQEILAEPPGKRVYFSTRALAQPTSQPIYFFDEKGSIFGTHYGSNILVPAAEIPSTSFPLNWLIVSAALDLLGYRLKSVELHHSPYLTHRLEKIATINDVTFYNDSKATVMEATLSAIEALQGTPIYLLLGGLSKGVSRREHIKKLVGLVQHVSCFGAEASALYEACQYVGLSSSLHTTLGDAFAYVVSHVYSGDKVLLSPGGSSYDLYKDYQERGEHFRSLVTTWKDTTVY